jgi:hypothetical protein
MTFLFRLCEHWMAVAVIAGSAFACASSSGAPAMLRTAPGSGFEVQVLFTTGESFGGYRPPGVLDGMVAFAGDKDRLELLVTHELDGDQGYPYRLANGTELPGSRITHFEIDRRTRRIGAARLAYREIRDRAGRIVTGPKQVNQRPGNDRRGLEALCSAAGYAAGQLGFADQLFFAHEEVTKNEGHPYGGTIYALDVRAGTLWALPALGRGSFENVTALATPDGDRPDGHIALLIADDYEFGGAPLYLWIGRKRPDGTFVERNGLVQGQLHVWAADNGDTSPQQWSGSGSIRDGRFAPIAARNAAGTPGADSDGYLDDPGLRSRAAQLGAFLYSRPEDLHTNPANGLQAVFTSTGQGNVYPRDDWGGIYVADVRFTTAVTGELDATARIRLLYDSDDTQDRGIRSPDNLVWATDGRIYVQEDMATKRARFGAETGREASIWSLDPATPAQPALIATIDRTAVPRGASDRKAGTIGEWESSGIVDVTGQLATVPGELVLLANVQAHSVTDGAVGGRNNLVQAAQLLLLTRTASRRGAEAR